MFSGSVKVRDDDDFTAAIDGIVVQGDDGAAAERDTLVAAAKRGAITIFNEVDDFEGEMTVSISGLATPGFDCALDGDNPHVTVTLTLAEFAEGSEPGEVTGPVTEHTAAETAKASH